MGSGQRTGGSDPSVAARTAGLRCATVGLAASASATSDVKPESPATRADSSRPPQDRRRHHEGARGQKSLSDLHTSPRPSVSGGTRRPAPLWRRVRATTAWGEASLGGGGERCCGSAGEVETPQPITWTLVGAETAPPERGHCGRVIAQNAGLAHGVSVSHRTEAGQMVEAICCSQLADVPRWTWSHNSGRPTANIWPLSQERGRRVHEREFHARREYYTRRRRGHAPSLPGGIGSSVGAEDAAVGPAWAEEPFRRQRIGRNAPAFVGIVFGLLCPHWGR